jgi:hypothetical protein
MVGLAAKGRSYELIGVTSFGYGCADPAYPGKTCTIHKYPDTKYRISVFLLYTTVHGIKYILYSCVLD